MKDFLKNEVFGIVSKAAEEEGVRAFVIGGFVRDAFLGRPSKDIDIVVEETYQYGFMERHGKTRCERAFRITG